jgi:hypothetical protein
MAKDRLNLALVDTFDQCRTDKDREQWVHRPTAYLRDEIEPRLVGAGPSIADACRLTGESLPVAIR